ncbi:MAG: putative toxin-antitoxin system toxin component, PIN family [Caldilineales bacterium]|nr:putative toxin-antitoxin system toxin component, PIN family [Caldilineales bacterium]MCW5858741.1 putative toxin-antitoxin system toxin component, PIN family [Caldilineales bacterium]
MIDELRAVFDTNVYVSVFLSKNQDSAAQKLFRFWRAKTFLLLICDQLLDEIVEKLLEKRVDPLRIRSFLVELGELAAWITVTPDAILPIILADPDDDVIVACAVAGKADYLVSNDGHFDVLGGLHRGIRIVRPVPFLWAVRQSLGG